MPREAANLIWLTALLCLAKTPRAHNVVLPPSVFVRTFCHFRSNTVSSIRGILRRPKNAVSIRCSTGPVPGTILNLERERILGNLNLPAAATDGLIQETIDGLEGGERVVRQREWDAFKDHCQLFNSAAALGPFNSTSVNATTLAIIPTTDEYALLKAAYGATEAESTHRRDVGEQRFALLTRCRLPLLPSYSWFKTVSKFFLPLTIAGALIPKLAAPSMSLATLLTAGLLSNRGAHLKGAIKTPADRKTVVINLALTAIHGFIGGIISNLVRKHLNLKRLFAGEEGMQALCVNTQMWLAAFLYGSSDSHDTPRSDVYLDTDRQVSSKGYFDEEETKALASMSIGPPTDDGTYDVGDGDSESDEEETDPDACFDFLEDDDY